MPLAGAIIRPMYYASAVDTASSGSITTTETVTDTLVTSLVAGSIYRVEIRLLISSTTAADDAIVRLREDSLTGTQIDGYRTDLAVVSPVVYPEPLCAYYTAVSTGAKTFVATLIRSAGGGNLVRAAGATAPSVLTCLQVS